MTPLKHVTILFALLSLIQCSLYAQINSFPYLEDFENGPGGWTTGSLVASPTSSWVLGNPVGKAALNKAQSGNNCWMMGGLTGLANYSESSYIESPDFDFSGVNFPTIAFWFNLHVQDTGSLGTVWYSHDAGATWVLVGANEQDSVARYQSWYNIPRFPSGDSTYSAGSAPGLLRMAFGKWSFGPNPYHIGWRRVSKVMPYLSNLPQVRFRIQIRVTDATRGPQYEGLSIDNVQVTNGYRLEMTDTITVCEGMSVSIDAPSSHGIYSSTYNWSTGETSRVITADVAGKYICEVSTPQGIFKDSTIVRYNQPVSTADTIDVFTNFQLNNQVFPNLDTVSGCISPPFYLQIDNDLNAENRWIYPNGDLGRYNSNISPDFVGTSIPGWYTLLQSDQKTCLLKDSIYMDLSSISVSLGLDLAFCQPTTIAAIPIPSSHQLFVTDWYDSLTTRRRRLSNTLTYTVQNSGAFIITAIDANSCYVTDTVAIYIGGLAAPITTAPDFGLNDGAAWLDQSIRLSGTAPLQFDWDSSGVYTSNDTLKNLAAGTYHVRIIDANGCTDTVTYTIQSGTAVMPGDSDFDQDVDMADLLPIGLHYNVAGPPRQSAVIAWLPQACPPWTGSQANGQSLCHVDTDGSGLINDDDTLAIVLNYGNTHGYSKTASRGIRLHFQMPNSTKAGDTLRIPLLIADMDTPATNVRGISFSINYDTALVVANTAYMDFNSSWLGTKGVDMLSLQRDDFSNGKIDIGMVRTDTVQQTGYGRLADIVIVTDDHIGKRDVPFRLTIDNIYAVDNVGDEVDFVGEPGVVGIATGIADEIDESIAILPNPNKGIFTLNHPQIHEGSIRIFTIQGKLVGTYRLDSQGATSLDTGGVPAGLYYVLVENKLGKWTRKVVIE